MAEVWLQTNRRAVLLGLIVPLLLGALGIGLLWLGDHPAPRMIGSISLAMGVVLTLLLIWQLRQPRLAYEQGKLLFFLRSGGPIRVPVEVIECFLLGQTDALLSGKQNERSETRAVMVRLSEKAEEWSHQEVKPALGRWCDGYVIIRGTWCEPLSVEVVNRLNQRLAEATRQVRASQVKS
jgi:hypothetical protein